MKKVMVSGYNRSDGKREFEILDKAELEKLIDDLNAFEVYQKTFTEGKGMSHSGTAYTYLDARTGELVSGWLGANNFNHPWDSFYEIWLCSIKTGCEFPDLNTADMLLNDTEQEDFQDYEGSAEDYVLEKHDQKELDDRIDAAIDWLAQEFSPDYDDISRQAKELYELGE